MFVKEKIMEGTNQKNDRLKRSISIVLLVIAAIGVILAMILQKCNILAGYIIAFLCGSILFSVVNIFLIQFSINPSKNERFYNGKNISKIIISLVINLLFVISSTAFIVYYNEKLNDLPILISSQVALILLIIIVYNFTNIKNGDDISLLKAMNFFFIYLFTVIKLLNIGKSFFIEYYYLLPLIIVQGLYELFDRKSKLKNDSEAQE